MSDINYYNNPRLDVIEFLPKREIKKILEIGGGDFPTLDILTIKYESESWGVDIYPTNNNKIRFIQGSIEDKKICASVPENYFDLIVANDVVEHLENTENFLKIVSDKLNVGGLLILSVPNIRQIRGVYHIYIRGTFPRDEAGLFDKTHLRWFCKKDVLRLAERGNAGFKLIDSKSVGRLLPKVLEKTIIGEFLGLQNIFLFEKIA